MSEIATLSVGVELTEQDGKAVLTIAGFPGVPEVRYEFDPATGVTTEHATGDLVRVRQGSLTEVVSGDRVSVVRGDSLLRTGGDHVVMTNGIMHVNPIDEEDLGVVRRLERAVLGALNLGTRLLVRRRRKERARLAAPCGQHGCDCAG